MTSLSLPSFFVCLFVCLFCLILALSVLPIVPEQTSSLFQECVASVSVRFRSKERGTRARSSDGRDGSVLDSYTGKTRGDRTAAPSEKEVGWHPGLTWSFAAFFCLCFFFVLFFCFLLLVIVTFLSFVLSSSPVGMTLEYKQIVPFSSLESLLFALWQFARDTSCGSVWPMKSSLHASDVAKGAEAEALQRIESVQFREEFSNF